MKRESAKFILSKKRVFEAVDSLKDLVDEVSYSWKTNPRVGEVLNEKDYCYFSVHSIRELEQVQNKSKIWYFPFALEEGEVEELIDKYNLRNFVFDNEEDLKLILAYIEKKEIKVNILLRMKLKENSVFAGKHYVFGFDVSKTKELILELCENKLVLDLGVHFHRKTQNVSEWSLKDEVFEVLGEEILEKISLINIGGGLPGKYKNTNDKAQENIFSKIKEFSLEAKKYNIKTIIEPGRFVASGAVKLRAQIVSIIDNTVFLNCSIFNGALDTVVANVKLLVENESESGTKYMLKGSTPDSCDILRYLVYLDKPKKGDFVTFLNCGAYTYTTNFCALEEIDYEIID